MQAKLVGAAIAHLFPFVIGAVGLYLMLDSAFTGDLRKRKAGFLIILIGGPLSVYVTMAVYG